jgi:glutaconate CoA-transferase subunit A
VALVPPLLPEVCVLRAQRVALDGTVRIEGLLGPDLDQSLAGRILIVECERICSPDELRSVPEHNQIAAHFVDAIVEQPFGGYPTAVPNYYDYDYEWFKEYQRTVRGFSLDDLKAYWQEQVASTEDDWEYLLDRVGLERLSSLRADPRFHYNPNIERFK